MSIRCDEVMEQLGELLGGRLPVERRQAIEEHLSICPACHEYAEACRLAGCLGPTAVPRPPAHLQEILDGEGRD